NGPAAAFCAARPDKPDFGGFLQGNQHISPRPSHTDRPIRRFGMRRIVWTDPSSPDQPNTNCRVPARIRGWLFEFAASHLEFAAG
ncbi:hypothetical protein, partial [Mesorhizobium sp.]